MDSTLKPREAEPHEAPAIAPDIVPAAWADRVLEDITRDAKSHSLDRLLDAESHLAAEASVPAVDAPAVDTTFRPTAVDKPPRRWLTKAVLAFMFALGGVGAAADWQHYGGVARELIANWTPRLALTASLQQPAASAEPAAAPSVQASAAEQTSAPQAAAAAQAAPASPAEAAAPVAAALAPDTAQVIQSMARDLAAMGQQIDQLKASVEQLKANQQTTAPDSARFSEAKASEAKAGDVRTTAAKTVATRTPAPAARPKLSAVSPPPPRPAAAPLRKPVPAYAASAPLPLAPPAVAPAPPPPQATTDLNGEPVVRPPMPLH